MNGWTRIKSGEIALRKRRMRALLAVQVTLDETGWLARCDFCRRPDIKDVLME